MAPADNDRERFAKARQDLGAASQDRLRKLAALAGAQDALRAGGPQHPATQEASQRVAAARDALRLARGTEADSRANLRRELASVGDPASSIAALDPGCPLLLFPVRLETRFVRLQQETAAYGGPPQVGELWVRIYPDGILCDSHEPLLSADEVALGQQYWIAAWQAADARDAWTVLVARCGAPRGAWIVARCTPTNIANFPRSPDGGRDPAPVFVAQDTRPRGWQRLPVARLLPDRWIVAADPDRAVTDDERSRYRVVGSSIIEPLAVTLSLGSDDDASNDGRVTLSDDLKIDPELQWCFDFARAEEVGMALRIPLIEDDFNDGFVRVIAFGVNTTLTPAEAAGELAQLFDSHHYSRGLAFVPQGTPTNTTSSAPSGYPPPDPRAANSFRVERGPPLTSSGSDGSNFTRALGLPAGVADHIAGADGAERRRARAMALALWPATRSNGCSGASCSERRSWRR